MFESCANRICCFLHQVGDYQEGMVEDRQVVAEAKQEVMAEVSQEQTWEPNPVIPSPSCLRVALIKQVSESASRLACF